MPQNTTTSRDARTVVFFAVDFRPDFGRRLAPCAENIQSSLNPDETHFNVNMHYIFSWWQKRKTMTLTPKRFACQTLGLDVWRGELSTFIKSVRETLTFLEVTSVKRIGFKVYSFLNQEMSHAELADLFFGTYLCVADDLSCICDKPADPSFTLSDAERSGMGLHFRLTAATPEQSLQALSSIVNSEQFAKKGTLDTTVRNFFDTIVSSASLLIEVDLFQENVDAGDTDSFMKKSLREVDEIVLASQAKLLSRVVK